LFCGALFPALYNLYGIFMPRRGSIVALADKE
jgi:hypothetical protein